MKFGVVIRNMGPAATRETLGACVTAVEQAGFDAAFVVDHLAIPPDQTEGSGGRYFEPLTTLAYFAGMTKTIRLGVSVLVFPYRPAVYMAKQVATLQELSGGRIILGAGVGWMRPEFHALGVDPRHRGAITNESLAVVHKLFANDVNSFDGKHIQFPEFVFAPRPTRPPIWVGGAGEKAIERTIKWGDGYYPIGLNSGELAEIASHLREQSALHQRSVPDLIVGGMMREGSPQPMIDKISAMKEAGADYYVLGLGRYSEAAKFKENIQIFRENVMPLIQ